MSWSNGDGVNLVPKAFAGLTGLPNIGYDLTTGQSTGTVAAVTYYVDSVNGNDAWNGLSRTFGGGSIGPRRTPAGINNIQPSASGHVVIKFKPGTYRGTWTPQYSGTDNNHRIILEVDGIGIVTWLGPASGEMEYAMQIGDGFTDGGEYTRNYLSVLRTSESQYFRIDGEVIYGTGAGQIEKGENIESFGHIHKLAHINGVGIVLECQVRRTQGNDGLEFGDSTDLFVARIDWEQHGAAFNLGGEDYGDMIRINQSISPGS
jgi:hypothetical protein